MVVIYLGAGSVIAFIRTASQREPNDICGKPNQPLIDVLMSHYKIEPSRTMMVGDRSVSEWFSLLYSVGVGVDRGCDILRESFL